MIGCSVLTQRHNSGLNRTCTKNRAGPVGSTLGIHTVIGRPCVRLDGAESFSYRSFIKEVSVRNPESYDTRRSIHEERESRCEQDDTERNALVKRIWDDIDKLKDPRVADRVRENLLTALSKEGDTLLRDRLMDAYNIAVGDRMGKSLDPVLRDTEYYLLGLAAAAERNVAMVLYTQLTGNIYDTLKSTAHDLKDMGFPVFENALRTNKSEPTSRPGDGPAIARQGLLLGYKLDGDMCFHIDPRRGSPLPETTMPRLP